MRVGCNDLRKNKYSARSSVGGDLFLESQRHLSILTYLLFFETLGTPVEQNVDF